MAQRPSRSHGHVTVRECLALLRRHVRALEQIERGEFDGISPGVRAILERMLVQMRALIERDQS